MRAELKQDLRDTVKGLSDFYNVLKTKYDNHVALSRMIYALEILGHRRYGCRAVRELERLLQCKPEPFNPFTDLRSGIDTHDFCLHQCLAIACRILPEESNKYFKIHFAKILKVNHQTMKTPCEVITKLLEHDKITFDNQLDLVEEAFIKSKLSESKIKEYHESGKD